MSKRAKINLLCGLTIGQWEELIVKPYLTDSITSMRMLKRTCKFFSSVYEILLEVSRKRTFQRLRWIRDILMDNGSFRIDFTDGTAYFAAYVVAYCGRSGYYVEDGVSWDFVTATANIDIVDASQKILRHIRDNHDITVEHIYNSGTRMCSIKWTNSIVPERIRERGQWVSLFEEIVLPPPDGLVSQELIKSYVDTRKENGYWDMDSAIDMKPDLSLPINDDLL